jgi:hypothetical protein
MLNDIGMDKPGQLSNCDISDLTRSAEKDALGKKNVCDCFLVAVLIVFVLPIVIFHLRLLAQDKIAY